MEALVDVAARVLDEECARRRRRSEEVLGGRVGEEVQGRCDDEPVAAQVVLGVGEVGGDVRRPTAPRCARLSAAW